MWMIWTFSVNTDHSICSHGDFLFMTENINIIIRDYDVNNHIQNLLIFFGPLTVHKQNYTKWPEVFVQAATYHCFCHSYLTGSNRSGCDVFAVEVQQHFYGAYVWMKQVKPQHILGAFLFHTNADCLQLFLALTSTCPTQGSVCLFFSTGPWMQGLW